jgi:hypothetical protein
VSVRSPELSVLLHMPHHYAPFRQTIDHLRAQTALDRLELVIVTGSKQTLGLDAAHLAAFPSVQVIEVGSDTSPGAASAAAMAAATAPVVVIGEDHSRPEPGWAEALIQAHRGAWAAVGPRVKNGNPTSPVSWANYVISFARWADPAPAGQVPSLPSHNTSYKRSIMLQYGPALAGLLEVEGLLHADLRAKGYPLYLEPAAVTHHINIIRWSVFARDQFHSGRLFAGVRVRQGRWSWRRRWLYIVGAPLIPLVRLWRISREPGWQALPRPVRIQALLPLLAGIVLHTLGEVVGYVSGSGDAAWHKSQLENYAAGRGLSPAT